MATLTLKKRNPAPDVASATAHPAVASLKTAPETNSSEELAAGALHQELFPAPWLQSVGVGQSDNGKPCLFIYTQAPIPQTSAKKIPKEYHSIPVVVRKVGTAMAA